MKIYLTAKIVLVLALLATTTLSTTADDDEVDTSIPGYPHKIYSGTVHLMQDSSYWASLIGQKISIMYSSPLKTIFLTILLSFGLLGHLDAHLS
jgi:hypothetical protein